MNVETFRQVPVDIEVEQALLGAILVDNRALERAAPLLKAEHFYDPLHQRIYSRPCSRCGSAAACSRR